MIVPEVVLGLIIFVHLFTSDGPKQVSAEVSAEITAEISDETEISVMRTEISVCRHYKEMTFRQKSRNSYTINILLQIDMSGNCFTRKLPKARYKMFGFEKSSLQKSLFTLVLSTISK